MRRTRKPQTWRAYDHERPHSKSAGSSTSATQAINSHSANGTTGRKGGERKPTAMPEAAGDTMNR